MPDKDASERWAYPDGVEAIRVESTAYFAVQPPLRADLSKAPVLVALHGWGQRAPSFLRRFAALKESDVFVIAPQAPHQTYMDFETRKVGFSWLTAYDRSRAIPDLVQLLDAVQDSVEREYGLGGPRFYLGFSQGVSVAYRYALRGARRPAGVIACGGDLPPDVAGDMAARAPFPVLLVHGDEDSIVPPSKCDAAQAALGEMAWPHEVYRFHGAHDIPPSAVSVILDWIHLQS